MTITKNLILSYIICCLIIAGCKAGKTTGVVEAGATMQETPAPEKTRGKISHQFRSTGCATVIVVDIKDKADTLILIPKDALPSGLDVNGLEVFFNYHSLRMPQPPGCNKGIPVEITDLEKR